MAESRDPGAFSLMTPQKRTALLSALERHPVTSFFRKIFSGHGELFHVGGSVRDALLGKDIHDLDFSSSLSPAEILALLNSSGVRCLEMSAKHGTIIAVVDGQSHEITQFRDSSKTCEGDLALRDFTINALAFPVVSKVDCDLVDPLNGLADLESGVLRGCGDPGLRFQEDALRVLRALRFGPGQNFTIEAVTNAAASNSRELLRKISPERIREELERILLSENPRAAFRCMHELKILEVILPEVLPSIGSEQNEWHVEDVFEHTLTVIERSEKDRIQRWCALFHDLGKPATTTVDEAGRRHFYGHEKVSEALGKAVMERLKFSVDDQRLISLLVRQHMRPMSVGESGIRRILRDLGDAYAEWRKFKWADAPPAMEEAKVLEDLARFDRMVDAEINRPKGSVYSALAVDGNDLIAIGFSQGKNLGDAIKALHEAVLDDPNLNEREKLLELARGMKK